MTVTTAIIWGFWILVIGVLVSLGASLVHKKPEPKIVDEPKKKKIKKKVIVPKFIVELEGPFANKTELLSVVGSYSEYKDYTIMLDDEIIKNGNNPVNTLYYETIGKKIYRR